MESEMRLQRFHFNQDKKKTQEQKQMDLAEEEEELCKDFRRSVNNLCSCGL